MRERKCLALISISNSKINKPTFITTSFAFFSTNTNHIQQQLQEEEEEKKSISSNDSSYWTKKIHNLCTRQGKVDEALALLDRLRLRGYRPNSLNLNSIIHALCDSNRYSEAHHRFLLSLASHFVPDERTCNVVIARLLDARTPTQTLGIVESLIAAKPGFVPSLINYNRLIDQLCSFRMPNDAHRLFFDMKSRGHSPSIVSYTALINRFCKIGELDIAQKLFDEMQENGVQPNSLTYSVILRE